MIPRRIFFILNICIIANISCAQNDDLQLPFTIGKLRAEQLTNADSNSQPSLTILPVMKRDKKDNASFLPLVFINQYNTDYPFGWNDGAMIPAKGYQTYISTGFHAKYKIFDIKFKPEFVYARNNGFDTLGLLTYDQYMIDNPERFGTSPYHKFGWGQSHFSVNYKKLSLAISTENLWWGPGLKNSLVLSNNAPGFPHLSFNTTEPIRNFLGGWEFQLISGFLKPSGFYPNYYNPFHPSGKDKRYFNAVIITYQPKWITNFYIGVIRGYDQYYDDAQKNSDFMPVFLNLFRKNDKGGVDDLYNRDQVASVFFRYVFKKSHFEIYGEYGREDASYNLRDFIQTPEHSGAYIFGFQKVFSLPQIKSRLLIQSEITHLQQTIDYAIGRDTPPWYVNSQVSHGWTNEGKILGAGIGPGNCRNISVSLSTPKDEYYGLNLMQIDRNNDLYYALFSSTPTVNRKWVDNVFELFGNFKLKNIKNLSINWNADYIRTRDRHWLLNEYAINDPNAKAQYSNNFQFKITAVYNF